MFMPICLVLRVGISSSLMGSLAKGFLWKNCGNSAENSRKFAKNTFYCVRKGRGNSAESLRKVRGNL